MITKQTLLNCLARYNADRGFFRKYFSWAGYNAETSSIAKLQLIAASGVFNQLNPTDPLTPLMLRQIKDIIDNNTDTGNLTKSILGELSIAMSSLNFVLKLKPFRMASNPLHAESQINPSTSLSDTPTMFNVDQIFKGTPDVSPTHYHLGVYTKAVLSDVGMTCSAEHDFTVMLKPRKEFRNAEKLKEGEYDGRFTLLNNGEWQFIPGATSNDLITAISVYENNYELEICNVTNRIKIRCPIKQDAGESLSVRFNVVANGNVIAAQDPLTPYQLNEPFFAALDNNNLQFLAQQTPRRQVEILSAYFNSFSADFDYEPVTNSPSEKWLNFLRYRVGACEQRATWFLNFANRLGLTAHMSTNQAHAFVVVKLNDEFYTVDLGGKMCGLLINPRFDFDIGAVVARQILDVDQPVRLASLLAQVTHRHAELYSNTEFHRSFNVNLDGVPQLSALTLQ